MKKQLWRQCCRGALTIMKILGVQAFVAILLASMTYAHDLSGQGILDKEVSIEFEQASLKKVLSKIERVAGVKFTYSPSVIEEDHQVSVYASNERLATVLDGLLRPMDISYRLIADRISLYKASDPASYPRNGSSSQLHNSVEYLFGVSGSVLDNESRPLPGANVLEKGTTNGTTTDANGNFTLNVQDVNAVLVFSFIGYKTQEVPVNGRSMINVTLEEDAQKLEEMVIIGYGTQRKSDLTGAVGSVNSEVIRSRPVTNLEQALIGRVPGVDAVNTSGRPGGSPRTRIRGITSVSNPNDPLYVVDGVMINVERLQGAMHAITSIDPSIIESVEVLKDASATAIYGARGANGVILITTKRGKSGMGRISFDSYVSASMPSKKLDLTNSKEFLMIEEIAYQNAAKFDPSGFDRGVYPDPLVKRQRFTPNNPYGYPVLFDENLNPLYDTDWQDEASRTAITFNNALSINGGDGATTYGINLSHRDEEGILINSWLERYSARVVVDSKVTKWLSMGGNVNFNRQLERIINEGWALRGIYQNPPIMPVKYPDGKWSDPALYPSEGANSRHTSEGELTLLETQNTIGNFYTDVSFTDRLKLRTMVAGNMINQTTKRAVGNDVVGAGQTNKGIAGFSMLETKNWQFENLLRYDVLDLNNVHTINLLLGQSIQTSSRYSASAETWGFLDNYYSFNNLGVGSNPRPSSSSASKYSLSSVFGRANYVHANKYLFTVTGRVDGSSKFGKNHRYAFFPSAAIGWVASEERFLADNPVISFLKLRSSFGMTGNSEINNYQYEANLGQYTVIFGNTRYTGIGVRDLANPDLKWETNEQFDVGAELRLFDDRISLELDLYRRVSKDMLLSRPVPASSGYTVVTENIGNMENRGIEIGLTTNNVSTPDFSWETTFNFTANRNKVLKLHGGSDIYVGTAVGGGPGSIIREGLPVNTFIGAIRLGTWGTAEAAEAATFNRRPGDNKYVDVNNDGAITAEDRVPIGNGLPDGFGAFVNTFRYKNFELNVDIQYCYGNDIMWELNGVLEHRTGSYNNMLRTVLNAWTPENQNTFVAQMKPLGVGYDVFNDSHRLKDGSFIRGRSITLSYTLPGDLVSRWGLSSLRIYANGQNVFTKTKFEGLDPDNSTFDFEFARGRSGYANYPTPRTFMLGINLQI